MNPLLLTTLFLVLFGIFGFHAQKRSFTLSQMEVIYQSHKGIRQLTQHLEQSAYLEQLRKNASEDATFKKNDNKPPPSPPPPGPKPPKRPIKSPSLNIDLARPPKEARLNFGFLLRNTKEKEKKNHLSHYHTLARLLRALYKEHPLFQESPSMEYQLIDALLEQKPTINKFKTIDELSTVAFKDESMQELFYFMLKGGFITPNPTEGTRLYLPSLLSYITFCHNQAVNILFAPQELIEALIPYPDIAEEVLEVRDSLLRRIIKQETLRKEKVKVKMMDKGEIEREFQEKVMQALQRKNLHNDSGYLKLFSFNTGTPGDLLVIRDPHTGIIEQKPVPHVSSNNSQPKKNKKAAKPDSENK
jgi:hypothetical protein